MSNGARTDGSISGFAPLGQFDGRANFPGWGATEFEEVMGPPPNPHRGRNRMFASGAVVLLIAGIMLFAGDDDNESPAITTTPSPTTTPQPQEGFESVGNTLAPVLRGTTPETAVLTLPPPSN